MQSMSLQASFRRRRTRRSGAFAHAGTVQVGGDAIYYQTRGDAELARQTVILLHGMAADTSVWQELVRGLPPSYYVIAPDLPGHGHSQGDGLPTVPAYGAFLTAFLNALGISRPVVVVGHCLGAAIALEFARTAGDRLAGLVISGLGTGPLVEMEVLEALERGEVLDEFVARRFSAGVSPEMADEERLRWHRTRPEVRCADVAAALAFVLEPPATRLTAPLLVVGAEADDLVPLEALRGLLDWYPGAEVHLLPDTGHLSMLEQPGLYRAALEAFLGKLAAQPPVPRAWA
jgi:pimeloyl-ACP methyl ester carboxylesterase